MAQTQKSTVKSHTKDFGDLVLSFEAPQRASLPNSGRVEPLKVITDLNLTIKQ
jgi:hypothetical protein